MLAAFAVTGVVTVLAGAPDGRRGARRRPTRHPRAWWSSAHRGSRGPTSTGASLPALDALAEQGAARLADRAGRAQPGVRGRRLAHPVGRPPGRRPCRAVPRAAAGRRRLGAALGRVRRRRGLRARTTPTPARSVTGSRHPAAASRRSGRARPSAGPTAHGLVTTTAADLPASFRCPVVLVDGGTLPASGAGRTAALARLDALVGRVRAADPGADVVVAGVGDGVSAVRPRAIVAAGPSFGRGLLTSASTRQPGVAQLQDLTATALTRVGASDAAVTGRPLTVVVDGLGASLVRRPGRVRDPRRDAAGPEPAGDPVAGRRVRPVGGRRRACCGGGVAPRPDAVPAWARCGAGVAVAATPVSTFVANLVPWWRAGAPAVVFLGGLAVVVALLTAAGAVGGRPPAARGAAARRRGHAPRARRGRAHRVGPAARLGVRAEPGRRGPVLRAGQHQLRALRARRAGRRRLGGGVRGRRVAGLGRGWRSWCSSPRWPSRRCRRSGPTSAGRPGCCSVGCSSSPSAAGVRLTWGRVLVAVVGAGALAAVVAAARLAAPGRPRAPTSASSSSRCVSGEAGAVVGRKLAQNVANLGSPPLLAIARGHRGARGRGAGAPGWRPVRCRRGGAARALR